MEWIIPAALLPISTWRKSDGWQSLRRSENKKASVIIPLWNSNFDRSFFMYLACNFVLFHFATNFSFALSAVHGNGRRGGRLRGSVKCKLQRILSVRKLYGASWEHLTLSMASRWGASRARVRSFDPQFRVEDERNPRKSLFCTRESVLTEPRTWYTDGEWACYETPSLIWSDGDALTGAACADCRRVPRDSAPRDVYVKRILRIVSHYADYRYHGNRGM